MTTAKPAIEAARLRERVEELEETLRAVCEGEIDSLFLSGEDGTGEIFTLSSADKPYRLMVEQMAEGAATIGQDLVVDYANSSFARMLSVGPSQILGHSFLSWVAGDDLARVRNMLEDRSLRAERCRLIGGRHQPIPVKLSVSGVADETADIFRTIVITDLREEQQLERLVREDRRKDEFLAMLAHELRNPLAPIQSALSIFRGSSDPVSKSQARALGAIERQMKRLVHLVDDLLDVARIRSASMRIVREPVRLTRVLDSAVEASRDLFLEKGHQFQLLDETPDLVLRGDHLRLVQVFSNLLNNASKYTPPRGQIELRTRREGPYVRVDVRDNGEGLAVDDLESLFELFAQADRTLDRSQGGLGLGLSLVRTLVELHGGRVAAESAGIGRGTTFSVWLVSSEDADETRPAPELCTAERARLDGLRILIVDDNRDAADMLTMLLEHEGHPVVTRYDGESAVEAATLDVFDLVLLDIGLPGLDGYEVARRLRAQGASSTARLVALTGYGTSEDRRAAIAAGFDEHLIKPVREDDLYATIDRCRAE